MTEEEIVKGCLRGDAGSQKALYEQHAGRMMSLCLRYMGSRQEAEDVFQEGFVRVFEKLHQFSGTGNLGGWIRMVIVNTALVQLRKNRKMNYDDSLEANEQSNAGDPEVLSAISHAELMALIGSMPSGYRTVFNLFAVEGYGHKEISEMLGISENTSKTQFLKARNFLSKKLSYKELLGK
jgi:RNA polymerase sigma-70 factor (ECF subfamily)